MVPDEQKVWTDGWNKQTEDAKLYPSDFVGDKNVNLLEEEIPCHISGVSESCLCDLCSD